MMTSYELFNSVRLREAITLADGRRLEVGTPGVVVEVFQDGQAYLVEFLGDWVTVGDTGDLIPASVDDSEAFTETIGLATLTSQQIELLQPALETVGAKTYLMAIVADLPDSMLTEVVDFAEFLRQKQRCKELA